jgi:hypothetical protein
MILGKEIAQRRPCYVHVRKVDVNVYFMYGYIKYGRDQGSLFVGSCFCCDLIFPQPTKEKIENVKAKKLHQIDDFMQIYRPYKESKEIIIFF